MAEKFPEINEVPTAEDSEQPSGDFLSRERELLGNEFATDKDAEIVAEHNDEDEDDFDDFKSQFPEVGAGDNSDEPQQPQQQDNDEQQQNQSGLQNGSGSSKVADKFSNLSLDDSEHIQEWKKTRDLEISKRDEIATRKLEDIKKDAQKAIDDFYENYNNKKDDTIEAAKKEEESFLGKRDEFLENGTVWDRAIDLLKLKKNSDAIDADNFRDKSRFRDLLLALKGKENIPGAAGF